MEMNWKKFVIGMMLMILLLVGIIGMILGQTPLSVGPDDVIRMARWSGTQWLPLWAVGVTGPLYFGPGKVGRLAYWDVPTGKWKEWNGTVPLSSIVAGNWKVFYTNGSGVITELPLGAAGTIIRSSGAAAAPTMVTQAITEHTGANWSTWYTNGSGTPTALALPAQYYYLQGNGVAAAPGYVNVLRPARITTTAGKDTLNKTSVLDSLFMTSARPILFGLIPVKDTLSIWLRIRYAMMDSARIGILAARSGEAITINTGDSVKNFGAFSSDLINIHHSSGAIAGFATITGKDSVPGSTLGTYSLRPNRTYAGWESSGSLRGTTGLFTTGVSSDGYLSADTYVRVTGNGTGVATNNRWYMICNQDNPIQIWADSTVGLPRHTDSIKYADKQFVFSAPVVADTNIARKRFVAGTTYMDGPSNSIRAPSIIFDTLAAAPIVIQNGQMYFKYGTKDTIFVRMKGAWVTLIAEP